jgi:hypothetical protein
LYQETPWAGKKSRPTHSCPGSVRFPCETPVGAAALKSGGNPTVAGFADGQVQFFSLEEV